MYIKDKHALGRALSLFPLLFGSALMLFAEPPLYSLSLFAASALHEAGHAAAIRICGGRVRAFSVSPFGFVMDAGGVHLGYLRELFICAGGIIAGGIVFLPAVFLYRVTGREIFSVFAVTDALCTLLNLLPIGSLDGGRILCLALGAAAGEKGEAVFRVISFAVCLLIWAYSAWLALTAQGGTYAFLLFSYLLLTITG